MKRMILCAILASVLFSGIAFAIQNTNTNTLSSNYLVADEAEDPNIPPIDPGE